MNLCLKFDRVRQRFTGRDISIASIKNLKFHFARRTSNLAIGLLESTRKASQVSRVPSVDARLLTPWQFLKEVMEMKWFTMLEEDGAN